MGRLEETLRIAWHSVFGHPRPWYMLSQGTFCSKCGEEIKSF